jgi:hypothetical protein
VETRPTAVYTGFYDNFAPTTAPTAAAAPTTAFAAAPTSTGTNNGGTNNFGTTTEYTPTALDLLVDEMLTAQLNGDPTTAATTRGGRLRELTGFDDLLARRIAAEASVREQKESQLSPEQTRKRRIQAGLAGLAERGLGGFGAGRTSEMDKIAAERLGIEETSLANLNSLIAEKRAMGMTQFEAENAARAEILSSRDAAMTAATSRGDAQRLAFITSQEKALDRANQQVIAEIQTSGSQFGQSLNIKIEELRLKNPELSEIEIKSRALQLLVDDELRIGLARVGVSQEDQDRKEINEAIKAATDIVMDSIGSVTKSPTQLQAEIFALAKEIRDKFYGVAPPTQDLPTRDPNAPPLSAFDGQ